LQTELDTIVTGIYKARYFSRIGFLGAYLDHIPSFIWLGIFASRVLVISGQRWRIGNGNFYKVCGRIRGCTQWKIHSFQPRLHKPQGL